jgi:hypothetical protein
MNVKTLQKLLVKTASQSSSLITRYFISGRLAASRVEGQIGEARVKTFLVQGDDVRWTVNGTPCGEGAAGEMTSIISTIVSGQVDGEVRVSSEAMRLLASTLVRQNIARTDDEALSILDGATPRETGSGVFRLFIEAIRLRRVSLMAVTAGTIFSSCGQMMPHDDHAKIEIRQTDVAVPVKQEIDEILAPYVTAFINDCLRYHQTKMNCDLSLVKVIKVAGDDEKLGGEPIFEVPGVVGKAFTYYQTKAGAPYMHKVFIRDGFIRDVRAVAGVWNQELQTLVYHELGHTRGLGHVNDGTSLMNSLLVRYESDEDLLTQIKMLFSDLFIEKSSKPTPPS